MDHAGTHRPRDTSFKGHIGQGKTFGETSFGDKLKHCICVVLHREAVCVTGVMMRPSASLVLHRYILVISNLHTKYVERGKEREI